MTNNPPAMRPLVSVIIPVFNGEKYLGEALDSVAAQDYAPFEVIVIDDGSRDRTAAITRSYSNVRYLYQDNQGNARARNLGIQAASGDLLAFLDADDRWLSHKLRTHADYHATHEIDYSVSQMRLFLDPGSHWPPSLTNRDELERIPVLLPSALVVRRAVMKETGGFDERYRIANDADWFVRARDRGLVMGFIAQALMERRVREDSLLVSGAAQNTRELLRVLRESVRRKRQAAAPDSGGDD